jgi:hypothetical protein
MRRAGWGIVALFVFGLPGCFFARMDASSLWPSRSRSAEALSGPDVVFLDAAILEVPVGDRYVNDELWTAADEQIQSISPALRKTLEENGLRVGLVGGRTPDGLLGLLTNERSNPKPSQYRRRTGNPATADLGSRDERCEFPLTIDGKSSTVGFDQAQCQLQLLPTLDPDGRVHIQFTPQIEFRDPKKWSRLNPVVALNVQSQRSTEPFTALRWEASLAPNDYLLIGARFDRPKSLGFKFLVSTDPDHPVQRLIAIRAGRFHVAGDLPHSPGESRQPGTTKPLAAQAAGR